MGRSLRTRLTLIHQSLDNRVRERQARQMRYDRGRGQEEFEVDDKVKTYHRDQIRRRWTSGEEGDEAREKREEEDDPIWMAPESMNSRRDRESFSSETAGLPQDPVSGDQAEASQELLWLLDLLKDLELEQKAPIYFHQDNQSCLKICSSEKVSSRTKHIATKIHHLKDLQKKTVIKMVYCPTGDMKADILTKPLPRPTFEKLRYNLVMSPHSCRGFVG
ncbi:hypothetical protein LAZ67_4003511 [Cordylochernes scorpioides]|uniref:Uncharacterized protein n=1 Tax=Cordylochernes scorpioides TaxID=51811 RepID=A0ABY6KGS2_9ARAC|nr:hypothetical protein LAZ67_4003511 [Cordylochernes scorpioides]